MTIAHLCFHQVDGEVRNAEVLNSSNATDGKNAHFLCCRYKMPHYGFACPFFRPSVCLSVCPIDVIIVEMKIKKR